MYNEYPPDLRLQHLIETYWVIEGIVDEAISQRIMPDGCVDIIFDFQDKEDGRNSQAELIGTMTRAIDVSYEMGVATALGIRFRPTGISALTKMPIDEITNQNIALPLTDLLLDNSLCERLTEMKTMRQRMEYINQYLIERLPRLYVPEKQIQHAVALITESSGLIPTRRIAEKVCMCERNFERKFKRIVGISPKVFSNVIRFRDARHYLKSHKEESIYTAAISCGYHDHSHMHKEFQRLGNIFPSDLNS
nr:helix-turn-helix domain-containing protein [uncultured Bacteroides sp.]